MLKLFVTKNFVKRTKQCEHSFFFFKKKNEFVQLIGYFLTMLLLVLIVVVMNDLNSHYSQLSETESSIDSPVVGQSCVALYEGMWYRANILGFSENDFTVHYVDYGNEETLEHSAVKQISPLFLKTTQVAVKCSLDPNRGQWSEKATALFEDLTGEDELVIKIIGQKGDTYQVKVFSKDEHCVSEEVYNTFSGEGMFLIDIFFFTMFNIELMKILKAVVEYHIPKTSTNFYLT